MSTPNDGGPLIADHQKYASELQTLCDLIIGGNCVPAPFREVEARLREIIAERDALVRVCEGRISVWKKKAGESDAASSAAIKDKDYAYNGGLQVAYDECADDLRVAIDAARKAAP